MCFSLSFEGPLYSSGPRGEIRLACFHASSRNSRKGTADETERRIVPELFISPPVLHFQKAARSRPICLELTKGREDLLLTSPISVPAISWAHTTTPAYDLCRMIARLSCKFMTYRQKSPKPCKVYYYKFSL